MTELNYDFVPVLSRGNHDDPASGACVMEMVSFMSGDEWTDAPKCTLPIISGLAQTVNDHLKDEWRGDIMNDFHRLFGTNDPKFAAEATEKISEYLRSIEAFRGDRCFCDSNVSYIERGLRVSDQHIAGCWQASLRFGGYRKVGGTLKRFRIADYAVVKVLTRVLDIYDEVSGRKDFLIPEVSRLAELECQKVSV